MTRTHALVCISLRSGRWLLPWIAVLLVSITLAYAATSTVRASWPLLDTRTTSTLPASGEPRPTAIVGDDEIVQPQERAACSPYSGAYGWMLYDMVRGTVLLH
jgi:hypothetical protein